MPITTSYFGNPRKPEGTKLAVVRRFGRVANRREYEHMPEFAPSLPLLLEYKQEKIGWGEYTKRYRDQQRGQWRRNPDQFRQLLERAKTEMLILCCYEKYVGPETQCHRLILTDILQKLAVHLRLPVEFVEERPYKSERDRVILYENGILEGQGSVKAETSALLDCAGLFVYSRQDKKGLLVHWQDEEIVSEVAAVLRRLRLRDPYAVIAGCGVPVECSMNDSLPYMQIQKLLDQLKIRVVKENVGGQTPLKLVVDFSNGGYRIEEVRKLEE